MLYRLLVRPVLFFLAPEPAHLLAMSVLQRVNGLALRWWSWLRRPLPASVEVQLWGLRFPSPIGLAAGFDKNGEAYGALALLGFGAIEVGTLTGQAQPGNPRPRLFRLPQDRALVNRMGFNNCGAEEAAERLAQQRGECRVPLGVNIGKTKVVGTEQAVEDYALSTRLLAPLADYLVVNVSSPNTPGLRDLQAVEQLRPLLIAVQEALSSASQRSVPLLLKIAPDLDDQDIDAVADLCVELQLAGLIATNTTTARSGLRTHPAQVARCGAGGLSGPVLRTRSLEILRRVRARVGSHLVLISAGGIETVDDVWERLAAGASLVQVYTGFVYGGPAMPRRLARELARRLRREGLASVSELIGRDSPVQGATRDQYFSEEAE